MSTDTTPTVPVMSLPTAPNSPSPVPPPAPPAPGTPTPPKNKNLLGLVVITGLLIAIGAGYYLGNRAKPAPQTDNATTKAEVRLPSDATVTAECVNGRGKQYVRPTDIPGGPIYDVHDGKVIAVEYLVGLDELTAKPEEFKDLNLAQGQYDHVSVVPTMAHAGLNELHFHVVSFLIPHTQADAITCAATTTTDETMHMH